MHNNNVYDAFCYEEIESQAVFLSPLEKLFRTVLGQLLYDLTIPETAKDERLEDKAEAIYWFKNCPRNYKMVCDYASIEPSKYWSKWVAPLLKQLEE